MRTDLVLASGSQIRLTLLTQAGIPVRCVPPDIDERKLERGLETNDPIEVAQALAEAKAAQVAGRVHGLVLAADQVIFDGGRVVGKPADPADHLRRLQAFAGRSHDLYTAWCVRGADGARRSGVERTRLWVRDDLELAELEAYVATGEGSRCAGGYAIEGHGAWLFERVEGCHFNILGLPLFAVISALRELGWRYPVSAP